ncbi:MAG: glycosyltransferase family 2 protein [Candidatus Heimdallarchaeota archaeon]
MAGVIANIKEVMDNTKFCNNYLVLVVNDGSTDRTAEIASKAGAYVYSYKKNQGLAQAFRTEMKVCCELGAEIIVHTDADGQYKAEEIPLLIEQIENGYDLVLGSRLKDSIEYMPKINKIGNIAFSFVISLLTKQKISDGKTGFRAFIRKIAEEIQIISDHTYTQEQIIRAAQNNYSIKEVPIYFAKRDDGKSRLMRSPFDYAFRAWKNILKIYFRKNTKS